MQSKVLILTAAILVGLGVKAQAQERWQGAYAGLSLSGQDYKSEAGPFDFKQRSVSLGAYAGYNRALDNSNFVWGPEISLRGLAGEGSDRSAALGKATQKDGALVDARMRFGYATDQMFFYGLAGFGVTGAGIESSDDDGKNLVIGTTFGIGAEMALNDRWSARADITKTDFGRKDISFNGSNRDTESDVFSVTLGLSRKF